MSEIQDLERAIAALESQRSLLGDDIVDTALAPLREKLTSLKARHAPERQLKYVTILFTDIAGSTSMGQGLDPEDTMTIMNGALERFNSIIQAHGGRVTRFMGDGLKAVFGIPTMAEDDAERAVRAGLALVRDAQEYARQIESNWQLSSFNIRVGLNTGQILIGGGVEDENTAMGMAINLAARMESSAPVGGVLISHNTYQHVRGLFEVQPQPPILVKGIDKPVQTYQVLKSIRLSPTSSARGVEGVQTPLIGRIPELRQLQDAYHSVSTRSQTHMVTLVGEAGVGKSRLIGEFEAGLLAQSETVQWFRARASRQTHTDPYSLLRNMFTESIGIQEGDSAEQARLRLEGSLTRFLGDEGQMKSHFIGALLGFDFSESQHLIGTLSDPKQLRAQALFYLEQYFQNALRESPAIILLEDIHWGDRPSLDFIRVLACDCQALPLLVLCAGRRILLENHPEWGIEDPKHGICCTRLEIQPLPEEPARALVQALLKRLPHVPAALYELIIRQAEGNPYYIEELINVLIHDGVIIIEENTGDWLFDSTRLQALRIPPTLTAVLQARLDRLPPGEKTILQQASIIGRVFWDATLANMCEPDHDPHGELVTLTRRELIEASRTATFKGVQEYAFIHTLFRDVIYKTVLKGNRQRYHTLVAEWLAEVTQANERSGEYYSVIAEHFDQGGNADQAASWYLKAGERAKTQGAPVEARHFFDRAIELLPTYDRERRWNVFLGRNEVLGILGEWAARAADDQELLNMADETGNLEWLATAYNHLGYSASSTGDERGALQAYEASLAAAREVADTNMEANILALATISLTRLGDLDRASEYATLALERAQAAGNDNTLARVSTNVAAYYSETGDIPQAIRLGQQQITLTQKLGERYGELIGHSNIGYNYVQMGMYTTAQQYLGEALRISEMIGAHHHHLYAQLNLGLAHFRSGEIRNALEVLEEATSALVKMGDHFGEAAGLTYHALTYEASGDLDIAGILFAQAHEIYAKIGMPGLALDAQAGSLRCGLASSQHQEIQLIADEILAYLAECGGSGMEFPILAYLTCGEAFTACGEAQKASSALHAGYEELMRRADKISDLDLRQTYLHNVPEHAKIISRFRNKEI